MDNMNDPIEVAPIVSQFNNGAVFQGAGNSHFTCDQGIFHVTTEVPGIGAGMPVVDHLEIPQGGY